MKMDQKIGLQHFEMELFHIEITVVFLHGVFH